jgi:hypothetical protein
MTDSTMTIPVSTGIGGPPDRRPRGYTDGMTEMTTIKVSGPTRDRLKRLADEEHLTMDAALSRALDQVEDSRFWQGVRADYARLQADPSEWADYAGELAEWDAATSDGMPDE